MILRVRPIETWPGELTKRRQTSPFSATYSDTLIILERELDALGSTEVVVQLAVTERDCRLDGALRADARPTHPGVIVSFETKRHGKLSYPCDTFDPSSYRRQEGWHQNLRAVALGLEALRKVQRYGIANTGQQYQGWKALGAGVPMPAAAMTVEDAARFLIEHGEWGGTPATVDDIVEASGTPVVTAYFREAAKKLHPDNGGDAALFARLTEARELLGAGSRQ